MKRIATTLALSLLVAQNAAAQADIIQSPAYKECIGLAASNPTQALAKSDEWLRVDNGVAAHHCRAMALFGLKRYPEAGDALDAVRKQIDPSNYTLRSFVTRQAATAWVSAGRADAAFAALDTQITEMNGAHGNNAAIAKLTAELLLERAKLSITYGKLREATKDLDHAISLTPLNAALLVTRAQAFEMLNDASLARADAEAVLKLDPANSTARALLDRLDTKK